MRIGEVSRATGETDIRVKLHLDGKGRSTVETGIGFFDHMLTLCQARLFDLEVYAQGDLEVDAHHTVEDVGIVLGKLLAQAWAAKPALPALAALCLWTKF